ncbi:triose-phosphate transporter family-domain-containing protein [Pyronema domesticum]|nr:triose-phosphate transporter family-domain-containing protein [Pyronema domesticum]
MTSAFPADANPDLAAAESDTVDSGEENPQLLGRDRTKHNPSERPRTSDANEIQPQPIPSLLTEPSTADDDPPGSQGHSRPSNCESLLQHTTSTPHNVDEWPGESVAENHEMDSYHGGSDDEEALVGGRQTRHNRRGVRHRVGDESEASLIPGHIDNVATREEKKEADSKVLRDLAINLILIGLWYTFSLLISVYNKWMFAPDHLNFHFPLFVTCLHMIVQFCLSSLVLFAFPHLRPAGFFGAKAIPDESPLSAPVDPDERGPRSWFRFNSRNEEIKKRKAGIMTKWVYLTKIFPCGAATGLDIGLGNMSLKFITLTFYTMCKSSSLAFVLCFAFLFGLEKPTWKLVSIIGVMTMGVVMMVASEVKFVVIGFILVILASALSGLRWSLTQLLLVRNPATGNPFSSIFFLAPCMFFSILAVAIPVEGFGPLIERYGELVDEEGFFRSIGIVIFPGVIAFLMVSSEFALLKRSSVVTLSIAGIFKEVMTISAAAIIFHDPLTPVNISGLLVTIVSIAGYNYLKITKMREEALHKTHMAHHQEHNQPNTAGPGNKRYRWE